MSTHQDVGRIVNRFIATGDEVVEQVARDAEAEQPLDKALDLETLQDRLSVGLAHAFREEGRRLLEAVGQDGGAYEAQRRREESRPWFASVC